MAVSFLLVVVLYETPPSASVTLTSLGRCTGVAENDKLVVVDHSRADQALECLSICSSFGGFVEYIHDPSNPRLGRAYNQALETHLSEHTYYVIFDQDSLIPSEYLQVSRDCAQTSQEPSAMAPNIVSSNRIASPCWSAFGWGRSWRNAKTGWFSWRICSAITSAVFVHRRVFRDCKLRYSEELSFYGIDTDFFRRLGRIDEKFLVLPLSVQHSLSFDEAPIAVKAAKLNQIYFANKLIFADSGIFSRSMVFMIEHGLRLKYAIKYRSSIFLCAGSRNE